VPLWNSDGRIRTGLVCVSTPRVVPGSVCRAQPTAECCGRAGCEELPLAKRKPREVCGRRANLPVWSLNLPAWRLNFPVSEVRLGRQGQGWLESVSTSGTASLRWPHPPGIPLHTLENPPLAPAISAPRRRRVSQLHMTSPQKLPLTPSANVNHPPHLVSDPAALGRHTLCSRCAGARRAPTALPTALRRLRQPLLP